MPGRGEYPGARIIAACSRSASFHQTGKESAGHTQEMAGGIDRNSGAAAQHPMETGVSVEYLLVGGVMLVNNEKFIS